MCTTCKIRIWHFICKYFSGDLLTIFLGYSSKRSQIHNHTKTRKITKINLKKDIAKHLDLVFVILNLKKINYRLVLKYWESNKRATFFLPIVTLVFSKVLRV